MVAAGSGADVEVDKIMREQSAWGQKLMKSMQKHHEKWLGNRGMTKMSGCEGLTAEHDWHSCSGQPALKKQQVCRSQG